MIAILTVLTGTKYSVDDVNKLYYSLLQNTSKKFKFYCYTDHERFDKGIHIIPIEKKNKKFQWYKIDFFQKDFVKEKDICVMDIDVDIVGNMDFIFDRVKKNEFRGTRRWWWEHKRVGTEYALSGTMYKFQNGSHQYVYNTFEADIEYWQEYYIKNGITKGPVNGEQHYVQDQIIQNTKEKSFFPIEKIVKWNENDVRTQIEVEKKYIEITGLDYLENGAFHPKVSVVHYAGN